jgi:hypothetical protein
MLRDATDDITAFAGFPVGHWKKIWSTNPLERLNKEIKRRTDVVGVFPNPAALLRLAGAVLVEAHDEWQVSERRYLSEGSMALLGTQPADPKEVATSTPHGIVSTSPLTSHGEETFTPHGGTSPPILARWDTLLQLVHMRRKRQSAQEIELTTYRRYHTPSISTGPRPLHRGIGYAPRGGRSV